MARIVRLEFGTLLKVDKRAGGEYDDWRSANNKQGLIVICMSEKKMPGKFFAKFFYTDGEFIQFFKTSIGDNISEDPKQFILQTTNSVYHFSLNHNLTEQEKYELYCESGLRRKVSGVHFDVQKH